MAKVIENQTVVVRAIRPWVSVVLLGLGLGFIAWVITALLTRYVIEPLTCQQVMDAAACVNAPSVAGALSAIVTGLIALLVFIRTGIHRPIVLVVATAALLWSLGTWTNGLFWLEAIAWSMVLYTLSYSLFNFIARYSRLGVVIAVSLLIVLIIRIALVL